MRTLLLPLLLLAAACGPTNTARLYHTEPKAPSLDAAAVERLDHLGPTIVDKGVNFGVYSERAERIELLLFDSDKTESDRPTRQFAMQRFGNVWNLYVEGIGVGQHYGFIAFGPNWPYDSEWTPGSIKGFLKDVDDEGNRFNPNKLLWDPYGKAIHRDHDWSKGSIATGPKRTESTFAAASKSVVVKSRYTWSDGEAAYRERRKLEDTPGHRWNDQVIYELHPKGFTASPASAVDHPGTYRGLGEKADYLKDLGITAVHLMPVHEKPPEGGYWGYNNLSYFIPENSYSFRKEQHEIIDEFKWMVDELHARDIEVILDVVYNHTGEGGFWRSRREDFNPDPSIEPQLVNVDPKEVVGLYNLRGFDNAAYYALAPNRSDYWNNTGVGNQARPNYGPMRRMIRDSLHYWVEELHVDGFRFDLATVLGEKDDLYFAWDEPKNTVLQDIADDPVLQQYNTRLIAEPWAAGGYDLRQSYNGPPSTPEDRCGNGFAVSNPFNNCGGARIGLFPAATAKPGTGWGEWNGRFRDWWRAFWNNDGWKLNSTEVRDGGFFMTGSDAWYGWNGRRPYHSINFITVHDGFTMYDLVSYTNKQNGCGPLNPVCCTNPTSAWCEKVSGEDNNRSRNWGDEAMKRQVMRNLYVAMMISHGTPLLYQGDEWQRTQLGNNNAYSFYADNEDNWLDWGTYQSSDERHRMHDFVKQAIRLRREHGYALSPLEYGKGAPFSWKSPQNTDTVNWGGKALMIHYWDATKGPELAILVNGENGQVDFTLPGGRTWKKLVDTQQYYDLPTTIQLAGKPPRVSNNAWLDAPETVPGSTYGVPSRSVVILEAR